MGHKLNEAKLVLNLLISTIFYSHNSHNIKLDMNFTEISCRQMDGEEKRKLVWGTGSDINRLACVRHICEINAIYFKLIHVLGVN